MAAAADMLELRMKLMRATNAERPALEERLINAQVRYQEELKAAASRAAALKQRGFYNQEGLADEAFRAKQAAAKAVANAQARAQANALAKERVNVDAREKAMRNEIAALAGQHKAAANAAAANAKAAANATAATALAKVEAAKAFEARKPGFFGGMWPYEDVLDQLITIAQHRMRRSGDKLAETAEIVTAMAEQMNNPILPDEERLVTRILYTAANLVNISFGGEYYNADRVEGKAKASTALTEALKLKGEMSAILTKYPKNKGIKNMLNFMFDTTKGLSLSQYAVTQAENKGVVVTGFRALMRGGARTRKQRKSRSTKKSRRRN
jgi:hypothetical protein